MRFSTKTLLSALIALPLIAICLIFQNDMRWLSQSRANLLAIIDVILFIPGLYTGNGNWSAPIINNGGLAAAQFIVFFTLCICLLSIPGLFRGRQHAALFSRKLIFIIRSTICGALAGAILMFASTLIGFFFIPKEDINLILSKTSSLLAAVVIGIIYGIFAGILVGSLQSLHEKDSLEKREQRSS
jgi:hypothetical protein